MHSTHFHKSISWLQDRLDVANLLTDALGSTRALTNAAGNVVQRYDYDPYGNTTATQSGFNNPYQYTGRERDASGMYYYRARYYSSGMSRFISEDPIGLAGGDNNFYAYVGGDPISYIDPEGLQFFPYSRNLNTRPAHRIPDAAAQRLNVVWGMGTAGAVSSVVGAPAAAGAILGAPGAAAAAGNVCKSPQAQEAALAVCITLGICQDVPKGLGKYARDRESLQQIFNNSKPGQRSTQRPPR